MTKEGPEDWRRNVTAVVMAWRQMGTGKVRRRVTGGPAWSAVGLGSRKEDRRYDMLWTKSLNKQRQSDLLRILMPLLLKLGVKSQGNSCLLNIFETKAAM